MVFSDGWYMVSKILLEIEEFNYIYKAMSHEEFLE
jgi:hypothetical protein